MKNWTRSDAVVEALNEADTWELRRALFAIITRLGENGERLEDMDEYERDGLVGEKDRWAVLEVMCALGTLLPSVIKA